MRNAIKEYYLIDSNATIKKAMENIDRNRIGAVFVTNEEKVLLGTITDGDVRRALLKGYKLEDRIENIYNKNFKYITHIYDKKKVKEYMLKYGIRQLPLVDENKKILDLIFFNDIICYDKKENYVFVMAGGLGARLRPLTDKIPKPMLTVGDKPILELIIEQFREYGYTNFIISLNYKGEIIENYFRDGSNFNVNIEYVKENKKLGTAGSISLAKDKLNKPFIVINGDILTGIDFDAFLNYHISNDFDITVGTRNYEVKIPYGVMTTENAIIKSLQEKPIYSYHINGGIYVINPYILKFLPYNEYYNMTDFIENVITRGYRAGIYNITDYWADIGQIKDYETVSKKFSKI